MNLKDEINPQDVDASWKRLLAAFDLATQEIQRRGPDVIPQIEFKEIQANGGEIPESRLEEIKDRGVLIIRNVVDPETALQYKKDVQNYIDTNREKIVGIPKENPQLWEVYWSKSQAEARSHPNFNLAAGAVNQLWHADEGTAIDFKTNVTYCDRLRIRKRGDPNFILKEHVDGGSIERWEDPVYRKCYSNILNGNWELQDAYNATHRINHEQESDATCGMFRAFQGWLSLSNASPGGGTLRVCPLIKLTTAYIMLRPFLPDLRNSPDFAGAFLRKRHTIPGTLFPHIMKAVVSIPKVSPGDCVFWHCDMVHAVEESVGNSNDRCVFYIPSAPLCRKNALHLAKQRSAFENGRTPPDFPVKDCEVTLEDRAHPQDLSDLGKLMMGFKKFWVDSTTQDKDAQTAAQEANEILFGSQIDLRRNETR